MSKNQKFGLMLFGFLSLCLLVSVQTGGIPSAWISPASASSGSGSDGAEDAAAEDAEEEAEEAAERAAEEAQEQAEEAAEAAAEAAEEQAELAAESAEQAAEEATEAAEEAAEAAAEQAEEAAELAAEQAEEAAELAAEQAEEAAELAAEIAEEAAEAAAEQAEEAAELAAEQAEEAAELAAEQAEAAMEQSEELAEITAEAAEELAEIEEKAAKRAAKAAARAAEQHNEFVDDHGIDVRLSQDRASRQSSGASSASLDAVTSLSVDNDDDDQKNQSSSDAEQQSLALREQSARGRGANLSQKPVENVGSQGSRNLQRAEAQLEEIGDNGGFVLETEFDQDNHEVVRNELLLLVDSAEFRLLEETYPQIERLQDLPVLGKVLAKYYSIEKFNPDEVTQDLIAAAPSIEVDRNHVLFEPSTTSSQLLQNNSKGQQPADLLPLRISNHSAVRIGIIDTAIDASHPWLQQGKLVTGSFVPTTAREPVDHGTAVVSTLVGSAPSYEALLPNAEVFAASIFIEQGVRRRITTTEYIAAALEWLIQQDIRIINMSFTGPYSRVLDSLIQSAANQGVLLVAAAGNHGPGSPPLYPAAYQGAIAVTAVAANKRIYRLANRGEHIMFAAPGVDILHAGADKMSAVSSGTSMASPFVAALLGAHMANDASPEKALETAISHAEDLGEKGRDETYGHGLIQL